MIFLSWFLLGLAIFLAFLFALFVWAAFSAGPFVPTDQKLVKKAIKLAKIKKSDRVADLGCGDGRFLVETALAGAKEAHGWDVNLFLLTLARIKARRAGIDGRVFLHWQDFRRGKLKKFNKVFVYLLPKSMAKVGGILKKQLHPGSLIISRDFPIPDWKATRRKPFFIYKLK